MKHMTLLDYRDFLSWSCAAIVMLATLGAVPWFFSNQFIYPAELCAGWVFEKATSSSSLAVCFSILVGWFAAVMLTSLAVASMILHVISVTVDLSTNAIAAMRREEK
jgi:hypothetical protein